MARNEYYIYTDQQELIDEVYERQQESRFEAQMRTAGGSIVGRGALHATVEFDPYDTAAVVATTVDTMGRE